MGAKAVQQDMVQLGDLTIQITFKDIKNIHLSVLPPDGAVTISAPLRFNIDQLRTFAIGKLSWIKQQQCKLRNQARETPREFLDRESHYLWGDRYLLNVIEKNAVPNLNLKHRQIQLQVRNKADLHKKHQVLEAAYRQQLKDAILPLISKWEKLLAVTVAGFTIRKMKTKWGSCTPETQTLRFNLELAKKPIDCLEYVVLHEMLHLLEPTHNDRFISLLNQFMPSWHFHQEKLNQLPLRHEIWANSQDHPH